MRLLEQVSGWVRWVAGRWSLYSSEPRDILSEALNASLELEGARVPS